MIEVRALGVAPDPSRPLFETERTTFAITGDPTATYALAEGPSPPSGTFSGLTYTAPLLPTSTPVTDVLEITARYAPEHPIFRGPGQPPEDRLLPEQRTNRCQALSLTVEPITLPSVGPVAPGSTTAITVPIAPTAVRVLPLPASATGTASVTNLGGRPAALQLLAPPSVSAPTDVEVELTFGVDAAVRKVMVLTVRVDP